MVLVLKSLKFNLISLNKRDNVYANVKHYLTFMTVMLLQKSKLKFIFSV